MIAVFFTAGQFIVLDALPKGQKCNQKYLVQNILPSLLNEKKRFSCQKPAIKFHVDMDTSMCHNEHEFVNELRCLKILKAPHPPYSPDISPCDFCIFRDFKRKLKNSHLQGSDEILTAFQELWNIITFEELQMVFQS
jgi:hypothetical protein